MPLVIPLVAAGVSAVGSVAGAVVSANSQQGIANAQAAQAAADRAAAMQYAMPTSQEIQQIGDRIQQQQRYQAVQEAGLARDEKLLGSLDPALITAGQQAQKLMSGQQASILAPMKQQQTYERNQLKQKLTAQLGPGFETSSAGQAALQNFDMNSNMQSQQAQMSAFNQVSQFLGYNLGQRTAIVGEERQGFRTGSEMSAETLNLEGNIQSRQVAAVRGSAPAMQSTAGSQYVGQSAAGGIISGLGESGAKIGTAIGGMIGSGAPTNALLTSQANMFGVSSGTDLMKSVTG